MCAQLQSNRKKIANGDQTLQVLDPELNVLSHATLVQYLKIKQYSSLERNKVEQLFSALQKIEHLFEIMSHLDLLITYTSWVPILLDVINFNKLADLVRDYSLDCPAST